MKIEELEAKIERNIGQRQVLTRMMAGGYLEPVLFKQKNNALTAESGTLQQEKENLIWSVHGDAEKAGLNLYHGSADRILRNEKYLGDGYYPAVISREIFDRAEEIRMRRAKALGRVKELEAKPTAVIPVRFKMEPVKKVSEDPFEQAAYAYGLIERVVETDGRE